MTKRKPAKLQPCGTTAAYQRHKRAGEDACEDCKRANRMARREHRKATTVGDRIVSRAQGRATARVIALHHDEYRAFYQLERARLIEELVTS